MNFWLQGELSAYLLGKQAQESELSSGYYTIKIGYRELDFECRTSP